MLQVLIHQNLQKRLIQQASKSTVDRSDTDKLKNVSNGLSSLKSKVGKLDTGKLETTPVDLSKLSSVVKIDVAKKTEYNANIKNIEDKIPGITNAPTKTTTLSAKINEVKGETPSITNLAKNCCYYCC